MKQFLAAAIIMAAGYAFAETPALYECIYNYRINAKDSEKDLSEITDCILQIGDDISKFYDYAAYRLDSVSALRTADEETRKEFEKACQNAEKYFDQLIMTDLADSRITVFGDIAPDRFKYTQNLPIAEWHLEDDTEMICGYECKKATGRYGERDWTVWYAEEIPVPFGPWKISGLPGLVMKATDSEGDHDFEATSFRKGSGEISAPKYPNIIKIKADQFIERKNAFDSDPMGNINKESIRMITVLPNKSMLINGVRIRNYPRGAKPLEFTASELKKIKETDREKPEDEDESPVFVIGVGSVKK